MSRIGLKALVPAVPLLLVVAGYGVGSILRRGDCSSLVSLACLAGMIVAGTACFRRASTAAERLSAAAPIAYVVTSAVFEPLAFVGDWRGVLISVAWLVPLVVGGAVLPGRGAWLAAAACWAVLFGGVAALAYNVSHVHDGVGFFMSWAD
jgi:hypothetical protein